jgi:fatty-acyl-CoA synthase
MGQASPGELHAVKVPELRYVIVLGAESPPGTLPFDTLMQPLDAAQRRQLDTITAGLKSDDPINIQFTSGTTGMPKGATLSHANIVNNARFVTDRICLNPTDRLVIPVPLYHCFGMVMGVLGAVSKGAAMVFPGEGFQAEQTLDVIAAERGTALYSVPTMFIAMLEQLEVCHRDMSSLRTGIMAGSPCPIDVMHRVNDVMHMREVTICYGMTETSPVSFQSFTDDPIDKRCETVGRVHPHLAVKIVDPDGNTVPVGHKGELCTRGYAVMLGYWEDSAATDSSVIDDWMHTGDLATLDADGYCTIVGRAKDMIIRGGENIYPREIEEFLIRHPKVMDAQVFGIPDDIYGEQVCAWVTHKPNTEDIAGGELIEYCKGKIAHFKLPAHVVVVESLPMTVTGKAQKYIMREKMQEMLSCDAHAISNRTA